MITRNLQNVIENRLFKGKSILLFGTRQVGKSTLLQQIFKNKAGVLWLTGDETFTQNLFQNLNISAMKAFFEGYSTVVIDEAQRIKNIGLGLKLIHDNLPQLQIVATGSSAFELANQVNEPLTGRKYECMLYPLSFGEMVNHHGLKEEVGLLKHRLVFGYYPEIVNKPSEAKEILKLLSDSFLFKDILMWERIKKPEKLIKLMQALALQVGNQVSFNELSRLLSLDVHTIEKYINLLEQTFVIFRLPSLARNRRNELKNSRKIYFYDNGMRNALIAQFEPVDLRNDVGALWENFVISERIKKNHYLQNYPNYWFWRTTEQAEIDFIEELDGKMLVFECKWNPNSKAKLSKAFSESYKDYTYQVIHQDNFWEFLR
jgi:hypothetical protein